MAWEVSDTDTVPIVAGTVLVVLPAMVASKELQDEGDRERSCQARSFGLEREWWMVHAR